MVESRRKQKQNVKKKKQMKPVKWYSIRVVFWVLVLTLCFVVFMIGWIVGKIT